MGNRGIIYILTNFMFKDNIIKIGKTQNRLEARIKELNRQTGVPFPFVCHSAFEIDNYDEIESVVHSAYRGVGAQTDEKHKRKEFFEVNPEKARELLQRLSKLQNGKEISIDDGKIYLKEEEKVIKEESEKTLRKSTRFESIGLEKGTILTFSRDENITCEVSENNKVLYKNELYSISGLTVKLLTENGNLRKGAYNGYAFWKFDDEILWDRRIRLEKEND